MTEGHSISDIAWDGFDNYAGNADMIANSGSIQYTDMSTFASISRPGRNSYGAALFVSALLSTFGTFSPCFANRSPQFVVGIACKMVTGFSPPADDSLVILFRSTISGGQFVVQFRKTTGSIKIYGGDLGLGEFVPIGPVIFETANNVWDPAGVGPEGYNYFEVKGFIHPDNGTIEVRVNNTLLVSLHGIQTQYVADNLFDSMLLGHPWFGTSDFFFDDFYHNSGTEFLGDSRVLTSAPEGIDRVSWTPLAKTNLQELQKIAFDGDAAYNFDTTPGDEDIFNFPPLLNSISVIFGLKIMGAWRKDDAGLRQIQHALIIHGAEYYGDVHTLPDTGYAYFSDYWTLSPASGVAFTDFEYNGISAGYRFVQ